MPRLEQWGIVSASGPYTAPEAVQYALMGTSSGDSRREDGHRVQTSVIQKTERKNGQWTATTRTGTVYELGEPAPGFLEVMSAKGRTVDQALMVFAAEECCGCCCDDHGCKGE